MRDPRAYAWQRDGWAPFICDSFAVIATGQCAALGGLSQDTHLVLFVQERDMVLRAPFQLKRRDDSSFFVSTMQPDGTGVRAREFIGYRHLKDAIAAKPLNRSLFVVAPAAPKQQRVPKRTLPRAAQTPPNLPVPAPKLQTKTALQLAFEKAQANKRT